MMLDYIKLPTKRVPRKTILLLHYMLFRLQMQQDNVVTSETTINYKMYPANKGNGNVLFQSFLQY